MIEERGKPAELVCPITHDIMLNPVLAADGHTYERAQIEAWLRTHDTSPLTGQPLESKALVPNILVRGQVREFLERVATQVAVALDVNAAFDDPSEPRDVPPRQALAVRAVAIFDR